MNCIKEIVIKNSPEDNTPIINVLDNGTSYLLFNEWPMDDDYFSDDEIDNFEQILSSIVEVKVIQEDRDRFVIITNNLQKIQKLQIYLEEKIGNISNITPPYKIINGKNYTKEEWEAYEAEEYKKYIDKHNKKTSSLFVEENPPQDFALETNGLKEIKHFVMNSRSEQVPVYQYPSTMVAPITFLPNGTVVEVLKKGNDGWCEVLSKDRKKGFIQSNFVKEN